MAGFRVALVCIAAAVFVGCATLAEYRDDPPKTADIVRNVRCELIDAILSDPSHGWLLTEKAKGWLVKLSFDLSVDHSGDISTGDNTWIFPMNQGATFLLTLGGGITGTGNRRENIEFDHLLKDLKKDPKLDCSNPQGGRFAQLSGNLGIVDLVERASLARTVATDDGSLSKLTYVVEFIVKKTANLAPKFNLIPIGKEKTFTGSPKWIGIRTDTQKLTITFSIPPRDEIAEECPVISDALDEWPDLVEPRRKCPTPVYQVEVKPACHILPYTKLCTDRKDCTLIKGEGNTKRCAPACHMLTERQCTGRKEDCTWNKADRSCDATGKARTKATKAMRLETEKLLGDRLYVPRPGTASPGGLSPADKDALDRAAGRGLLESIDNQLTRQRLGN